VDVSHALIYYFFLKSLFPIIAKYIATTYPQNEEEAINKAQQFKLIYTQSGYLYSVIPNAYFLQYFTQDKLGAYNDVDGLIGNLTQTQLGNPLPYLGNLYGPHPSFSSFSSTSIVPTPSNVGYYPNQPTPSPNPPCKIINTHHAHWKACGLFNLPM